MLRLTCSFYNSTGMFVWPRNEDYIFIEVKYLMHACLVKIFTSRIKRKIPRTHRPAHVQIDLDEDVSQTVWYVLINTYLLCGTQMQWRAVCACICERIFTWAVASDIMWNIISWDYGIVNPITITNKLN